MILSDTSSGRRHPAQAIHLSRRGFTLVEVLVTLALLGIVIGLLMLPVANSMGYFRSATARADAQSAARVALDTMARELTEAMYVQLDMYDNSMIALVPPLRVDPDDPNSEIVTPPRPDWSRETRFWRALHDPTMNYDPAGRLRPANTYHVARTVVPNPLAYDDEWNRWNADWAAWQDGRAEGGTTNWAWIPRVVHSDVDWRFEEGQVGLRNVTLQPGFPYLAVQYLLHTGEITDAEAARLYRDYVVALTPNAAQYDVPRLEFRPTVVAGEWLRAADTPEGSDNSVYRARYPLWRLGARYTGWAALTEEPALHQILAEGEWARDPFLLVYRYLPDEAGNWRYTLHALGVFDPRTRTLKVLDPTNGAPVYDSGLYPYRPETAWAAFGVDWIDGSLHFGFPPPGDEPSMTAGAPLVADGATLTEQSLAGPPIQTVYEVGLLGPWEGRSGGETMSYFLVPGSVRVRVDVDGIEGADRTLTEVFCTPRESSDEFQVGLDPWSSGANDPRGPRYGWIRLPAALAGGVVTTACTLYIDFEWRNSGVWVDGEEFPDLVSAYYRTASVLDVSLTVTKADPSAKAGQRVAQSANMTRRVKLRNLLREIRYAEE
jgi:prepilin-type N-terminal cleavage/methylation domain-containing protein